LERKGIDVLGVLPYDPILARPTIEQILEETDFEVLCGEEYLERSVAKVIVAAMQPRDAERYITDDSLIITPGDRQDMITIALNCFRDSANKKLKTCGMILTGGITPDKAIMDMLLEARIPVLFAKADTYNVATSVYDITVKIRPCDTEKVNSVIQLIKENVDFNKILKGI
jgi:phosphate acetyltransferase